MSLTRNTLREKLTPGTGAGEPAAVVVDALDGYIEPDEEIHYRLPGKGSVVKAEDGKTNTTTVPGKATARAVVTDRKLVFVVASDQQSSAVAISYTELKDIDAKDGLLRSKLTVEVWGAGEYRFKISDSSDLGAAVNYLQQASRCWDQVIATLDDARDHSAEMGEAIEAGDLETARDRRQDAAEKLEKARDYLDRFDIDSPVALQEHVVSVEREWNRTEVRTRISRAETLITEAGHHTKNREYTQAYRRFWYARDNLETAQAIARKGEISEPTEIEAKLKTIENRLSHLEVRPRALAQQACERARGTDKLPVEIEAWQEAFEQYRDALTAGWGTDIDFSGDVDELRSRIETVVGHLIEGRQGLAEQLEAKGDKHRRGHPDTAREQYDEALEQLDTAHQLAREFRAGDAESIRTERERLGSKRYNL